MKRLLLALALASGFALPVYAPSAVAAANDPGDPAENKAVRGVAMNFLGEIDGGRVGNTWAYVGDYLRGTVTRKEWEDGIIAARAGHNPSSRELLAANFYSELDGPRKGHFFIVFYKSRYGSQWIQERVVLTLQGKQWKVDGYWMLPADEDGNQLEEG